MKTSVALCTYNGAQYIREQLDSILNQTYKIDEIVVCDDGSTDDTILILESYRKKHPEVFQIFQNEINLRSVKNFEKAISLCSGDVVFLSDQDDVWETNKVHTIMTYFETNNSINVISTSGICIDEESKIIDVITIWEVPYFLKEKKIDLDYFKAITQVGNIATGASMAIKRSFFNEMIPFPVLKDFHHDEWIAIVASFNKSFLFIDEKLFRYRIHSNQQVGGVGYKNTDKSKQDLINSYNLSNLDNFIMYKRRLSRLYKNFKKFKNLNSIDQKFEEIVSVILEEIEVNFEETKVSLNIKYPLQSRLLFFMDQLLNKRQFKKLKNES